MATGALTVSREGCLNPAPESGPSAPRPRALPFTLDFSSPLSLPPRPGTGFAWPATAAGSTSVAGENVTAYVRRRYRETLFLPEVIATVADFAVDIRSIFPEDTVRHNPTEVANLLSPMLSSLPHIERRHRKTLAPILSGYMRGEAPPPDRPMDADIEMLLATSTLRATSRRAVEEAVPTTPKRLGEDLERREILMQIVLLLLFLPHHTPRREKKKKRKRSRAGNEAEDAGELDPQDDPAAALEVLFDRLSIWLAVSELGIGQDADQDTGASSTKGKAVDKENGTQKLLRHFWENVMMPCFVPSLPEQSAMFHLKVFGTVIPPKLLPPATSKKPRKPKVTRARPSTDDIPLQKTQIFAKPTTFHRTSSQAPSEAAGRASPSRELAGTQMRRSLSRNSESITEHRRSRSRSVDPAMPRESAPLVIKKSIVRAPSGRDLFKGREVIRRTNSIVAKKARTEGESQGPRLGLLGRKTSDGKERKDGESQRTSESLPAKAPNTIIFATPSKPRMFGSRAAAWNPTPIQEEPSSTIRPSFIAETPVNQHRIADVPLSGLTSVEEDDDDALGDLMVMTDEEDGDDDGPRAMIPETPAR